MHTCLSDVQIPLPEERAVPLEESGLALRFPDWESEHLLFHERDPQPASSPPPRPTPLKRVAYLMPHFSMSSETFILHELVALEQMGLQVELFQLASHESSPTPPAARSLGARAHRSTRCVWAGLAAQWYWLQRRPGVYLRALWCAVWGNGLNSGIFALLALVLEAPRLAQRIQQLGVEHLHAHCATHPTLAAYVIHQLTGLPYSFTAHAQDLCDELPTLGEKFRHASFVVTVSEYHRQLLCQFYGTVAEDKTVVVSLHRSAALLYSLLIHNWHPAPTNRFQALLMERSAEQ